MPDGKGGQMTLENWTKNPDNNAMYSMVAGTLTNWAASAKHKAFFTLGIQLKLPEADRKYSTYGSETPLMAW